VSSAERIGEPFHDKDSQQFVARYIERAPLSLEKLSIQDDIISYTISDNTTHEFDALEFMATLSAHNLSRRRLAGGGYRGPTSL